MGDIQASVRWCHDGHRHRAAPSSMRGLLVSRPLLEGHVRRRVAALPNVDIEERWSVSGWLTTPGRDRVTGIHGRVDGEEQRIEADLVVDASGRGSRAPTWLEGLGYRAPEEEAIDVAIGYATRTYRRRPEHLDGDVGIVLAPGEPSDRGGVVLALEGDRWVVTLGGYRHDRPPTDVDAWVAYAESLPEPDIADLVHQAEPLDDPVAFRYPASIRRRYERLRRFPAGLLVFGDALCSFNPIYGQGMTVAALEALALRDHLQRGPRPARRFFRAASRLIDVPWQVAVGSDLRFDHVIGRRTAKVRLVNRYLARLHPVAAEDERVALAFLRVVNLMDRPERLMAPSIAWRVLTRGRPPAPTPAPKRREPAPAV
jgi:2-polyprenyl-6-methoxyphenol hydroxylase-like FAD-dependent oxidoreductase